jgi:hypothetical protein
MARLTSLGVFGVLTLSAVITSPFSHYQTSTCAGTTYVDLSNKYLIVSRAWRPRLAATPSQSAEVTAVGTGSLITVYLNVYAATAPFRDVGVGWAAMSTAAMFPAVVCDVGHVRSWLGALTESLASQCIVERVVHAAGPVCAAAFHVERFSGMKVNRDDERRVRDVLVEPVQIEAADAGGQKPHDCADCLECENADQTGYRDYGVDREPLNVERFLEVDDALDGRERVAVILISQVCGGYCDVGILVDRFVTHSAQSSYVGVDPFVGVSLQGILLPGLPHL